MNLRLGTRLGEYSGKERRCTFVSVLGTRCEVGWSHRRSKECDCEEKAWGVLVRNGATSRSEDANPTRAEISWSLRRVL